MYKTGFLLRVASVLSASVFITGCTLHTVDEKPQKNIQIPKGYSFSSHSYSNRSISTFWHEEFSDKKLSKLISYAYENNFDINLSISRIKAARATTKISNAAIYPELFLEADTTNRQTDNDSQTSSQAGLSLSWEIDLFNKLQNRAKSDTLEHEALMDDLEALKLSLGSEIAAAYFGAVSANQTLELLNKQVELNEHYLELVKFRFDQGVATNLEILQQKGELAQSKSLIPPTLAKLRNYENRLDILLGKVPDGDYIVKKGDSILELAIPKNTGVPSELLLFRPDLRAQLKRLIAADADIAVAIAERLPSLELGVGGYYSDTQSYTGSLGVLSASLLAPLFDWGAKKAEVEKNKALYEGQLALFSNMYLKAIEEVENAIHNEKQQESYIERLEHREKILQETVKEAQLQYLQGVSDYLPVLNALVSLHTLQRSLIDAKYEFILNRIALHKALGSKAKIKRDDI